MRVRTMLSILAALLLATARWAALASGTMIFVWALLRHLPGLVANPHGIVLTQSGKALALSGGAFAVAGSMPL